MKVITIIILIFLSFNTSTLAQEAVSCETDEFTGNTTCKSGFVEISTDEAQVSRAILSFIYPTKSETYVIIFSFYGKEWSYLDTDTVYFLVDGERKSYDFQKVNSDIGSGNVIEQYAVQVNPKDFDFLTNSSEIRFKLRSDIYEFNEEAMNTIKDLKNIVNEKNY